jgi:hypothetical protein
MVGYITAWTVYITKLKILLGFKKPISENGSYLFAVT